MMPDVEKHIVRGTAVHEEIRKDLLDIVRKHAGPQADPRDMLAVASFLVGQLLTFQDQRVPRDFYASIIQENLTHGNIASLRTFVESPHEGGMQ